MKTAKLLIAALAVPAAALAQSSVHIVPAYTADPDNLIVVRALAPNCRNDIRPDHVIKTLVNGRLTLELPPDAPGTVCTAIVRHLEAAWTFRDLGLSNLPEQLTVQFLPTGDPASFQKVPTFAFHSKLADGWWKIGRSTVSWQQQGTQIGALILAGDDLGRATWRVGGGEFAQGRNSVALYESLNAESLGGAWTGNPDTRRDGTLEYAFEGPALAWVRYANTENWRAARPYDFNEDFSQHSGYFSLVNEVDISGSWRLPAALGGAKVAIAVAPIDPFEGNRRYATTIGDRYGWLSCSFESCVFDQGLGAPLAGVELLKAGMTRDTLSQRTASAWEPILLRD